MTILEKHLSRLKGQIAWITGGKRIGRNVARVLAEQGVHLVLTYRRSEREAFETAEEACRLGVRALALQADVSSPESTKAAVGRIRAEFGRLDILVNMASVYSATPVEDITAEDWRENIDAHIMGTFWPAQLAAPLMPPGSHIINIADICATTRPYKRHLPYLATKGAVVAMTKAMAAEFGPAGIFVNAIAPGPIIPPEDYPEDKWKRIRANTPVACEMTDEEATEQFSLLVLYLCLATMTTGVIYPLDQGQGL